MFNFFNKRKKRAQDKKGETWKPDFETDFSEAVIIRPPAEVLQQQQREKVAAAKKAAEERRLQLEWEKEQRRSGKYKGEYIFDILPIYRPLVYDSKIIIGTWSLTDLVFLRQWGYEKTVTSNVAGKGKVPVWYYKTLLNRRREVVVPTNLRAKPYIKLNTDSELHIKIQNQTTDHYFSVYQLAGLLLHFGFTEVKVNHRRGADVVGIYRGLEYGIEYEREKTRSVVDLKGQLLQNEKNYDVVKYICPGNAFSHVVAAVGENNVIPRGVAVLDWLNGL